MVKLVCLFDGNKDPQENVVTTVQEIMTTHKVAHLRLWLGIFQNNYGSWREFLLQWQGM
jgi:hypothetical protein